MKEFRFEIVHRPFGRFGWDFVVRTEDRRRVLARNTRDFGTAEKANDAIFKMEGAVVVDTTEGDPDPIALPATSFQIIPGVVPLLVQEFPTAFETSIRRIRRRRAAAALAPAALAVAESKPKAPAKPKAAAKPKTAAKRRAAGKTKPRRGGRSTS